MHYKLLGFYPFVIVHVRITCSQDSQEHNRQSKKWNLNEQVQMSKAIAEWLNIYISQLLFSLLGVVVRFIYLCMRIWFVGSFG